MNSTKKSAMTLQSRVADRLSGVVNGIEQRAEKLPAYVDTARKAVADRADGARRLARENPGTVIIGAFAIGLALATLARHA